MKRGEDFEDTNAERVEIPPPIPAFSWLGVFSPLLIGPILVLVLIALFAPDNVLDQWPTAKAFTNWMQAKLPFINRHADSTRYPQLALLVNCMTVALIPLLAFSWIVQGLINYQEVLARNKISKKPRWVEHLFFIVFSIPIFLGSAYFMVSLPGDPSWANGFTAMRRGGLALIDACIAYAAGAAVGGWVTMARLFIDLHLRGKNK